MIRRVRRQFIAITMAMLTTVLMVPLVALNTITTAMSYNQTKDLLEQIAISETATWESEPYEKPPANNGEPPPESTTAEAAGTTAAGTSTSSAETTTETTVSTISTAVVENGSAQTKTAAAQTKAAVQTTAKAKQTQAAAVTTAKKATQAPKKTTQAVKTTQAPKKTTQAVKTTQAPKVTQAPQTQAPQPDPQPDPDPYPYDPYPEPWHENYEEMAIQPAENAAASVMQLSLMEESSTTTHTAVRTDSPNHGEQMPQRLTDLEKNEKPEPPRDDLKKGNYTVDHFLCYTDSDGNLLDTEGTDDDYTEEDCASLVAYVLTQDKYDGTYGNLQYFRKDIDRGSLVVFSDRSTEHLLLRKVLLVSIVVFLFMEGVVLVLTMFLTKRAMRPMQETFERQRQFISDAGHELKTPLTIISANVDILQDEIGKNKWLSYIHSQTDRMRTLINEMMNLTKLEMGSHDKEFASFSLSAAVSSAALPFESQAFEQQKKLHLDIQEDLQYTGNQDQIKQLVGIFVDNAIKYSNPGGEIRVTLQQVRDKKILKFYNTGKGIPEEEQERIFERFYRSDSSRARNAPGGYGLGLSIAKSIADTHKIRIQIESIPEQWVTFILTF